MVTVCIPAYQAEAFIDRTLRCARAQTHEAQRILVAIDRSEDGTEDDLPRRTPVTTTGWRSTPTASSRAGSGT